MYCARQAERILLAGLEAVRRNPAAVVKDLAQDIAERVTCLKAETTDSAPNLFVDDLARMSRPDPVMLIADRIPANATALLIGPPGIGKSIIGLDMSLCAATGCDWHGARVVTRGPVVNVVAEGGMGSFKRRLGAAKLAAGFSLDEQVGVYAYDGALNLFGDQAVRAFTAAAAPLKPVLIVLDALNRCMPGGDENSAEQPYPPDKLLA
jgi:RecA-family ATPase